MGSSDIDTDKRRGGEIMRSGKIKGGLGSSVPALRPSRRAQTEHSELGWWMLHYPPFPPPSHFPPSFCEVSCSPRVKHTGVWEEDLMHTLTLHKDFMTAWELSRNVFCHIDSWDFFFYIYGVRLQPGNYAVLIGPSDWHPEQLYSHKEIIHT